MLPFLVTLTVAGSGDLDAATCRAWGTETLDLIQREYAIPGTKLLGERIEDNGKPNHVSFNWGVGVMLSSLAAGAKVDNKYQPWLREYADATRAYWNDKGPVPGYDVLPGPKDVDRYYDDNAWMAMALVETYEVLNDTKYLDWAEQTLQYVLSGEDEKLGGGIYWKEAEKSSKNTCSNGPSVAAALAVYGHRKKPQYLDAAIRNYAWCKLRLQDPVDHLYWDNVHLNGMVEKTKWTYNSGLMLRSAVELFRATGRDDYRRDAIQLEAATRSFLNPEGTAMKDDGKFAHLLFENWIRFSEIAVSPGLWRTMPSKTGTVDVRRVLQTVHDLTRDEGGHYGHRWDRDSRSGVKHPMLIDQASAARAYFIAADALEGK